MTPDTAMHLHGALQLVCLDCGLEKEHRTWQVQRSIAIDVSVTISWNAMFRRGFSRHDRYGLLSSGVLFSLGMPGIGVDTLGKTCINAYAQHELSRIRLPIDHTICF